MLTPSLYDWAKFVVGVGLFVASFFLPEIANRWIFFVIHALANVQLLLGRQSERTPLLRQELSNTDVSKLLFAYGALVSLTVASAAEPAAARGAPLLVAFTALGDIFLRSGMSGKTNNVFNIRTPNC